MINASISHELRNPLNAINAINIELKNNLQKLKEISRSDIDIELAKSKIAQIVKESETSISVMDSSSKFMQCLV
jgi:signal transduction histidine kinase